MNTTIGGMKSKFSKNSKMTKQDGAAKPGDLSERPQKRQLGAKLTATKPLTLDISKMKLKSSGAGAYGGMGSQRNHMS